MTNRLTDRLVKRNEAEEELLDDCGSFGWLRGMRDRALMLELRKKDATSLALAYSWLERAEFTPEHGIRLQFGARSVTIIGSGLNQGGPLKLFDGIIRHRVAWISEAASGERILTSGPVIEGIEWDR